MRVKVHRWIGSENKGMYVPHQGIWIFILKHWRFFQRAWQKMCSLKKTAWAAERDWNGVCAESWYCCDSPSWRRRGWDLENLNRADRERRQAADVSWDWIWCWSCAGLRVVKGELMASSSGIGGRGRAGERQVCTEYTRDGYKWGEPENQISFHFFLTPQGIFVRSSTLTICLTSHYIQHWVKKKEGRIQQTDKIIGRKQIKNLPWFKCMLDFKKNP